MRVWEDGRQRRRSLTKSACEGAMVAAPDIRHQKQSKRFELIQEMKERLGRDYVIDEAVRCLGVSKAGFYKWRKLHG